MELKALLTIETALLLFAQRKLSSKRDENVSTFMNVEVKFYIYKSARGLVKGYLYTNKLILSAASD